MTTHTIVTDPTSPEEVTPGMLRRVAAATAIGTAVEWYDFFIYGTAAALVFNKLFFPSFEPLVGTLAALSTYAVGFIARPLGGVVFGHIGDKVGRKGALVATLLIVGIGTFVIGLMPTLRADRDVGTNWACLYPPVAGLRRRGPSGNGWQSAARRRSGR